MFKKNFIDLCNKKGEAPSAVCRKVGITPATFSGWTEQTKPRQATLYRISDYFGVTPEYLLRDNETVSSRAAKESAIREEIDDMTPEELAKLKEYAEFIKSQRK